MNYEDVTKCSCGQYDENRNTRRSGEETYIIVPMYSKRRAKNTEFIESGQLIRKPKPPPVTFIADDNGCLLPEVRQKVKKKCNHWGVPGLSVWEDNGFTVFEKTKPICRRLYPDMGFEDLPTYFKPKGPQKPLDCSIYDTCNNICSIFHLCNINEEFENLRKLKLPVIWMYGYQQKGICLVRKHFLYQLFKGMGFTYIDMDQIMFDWGRNYIHHPPAPQLLANEKTDTCKIETQAKTSQYGPWIGDNDDEIRKEFEQNKRNCGINLNCKDHSTADPEIIKRKRNALKAASKPIQRCITLMYRLMPDFQEACTPPGLCEFLKCAFLQAYPTRGYVVGGFPINFEEAQEFEKQFWPVAGGIYFLNKSWTYSKLKLPEVEEPMLFRRSAEYNEFEVEGTTKIYAYKSIKIGYSPCVGKEDLEMLKESVKSMLKQYQTNQDETIETNDTTKYLAEFLPEDLMNSSSDDIDYENSARTGKLKYNRTKPLSNRKDLSQKNVDENILCISEGETEANKESKTNAKSSSDDEAKFNEQLEELQTDQKDLEEEQSVPKFGPSRRLSGSSNKELIAEMTPSNEIRSILQKELGKSTSSTNNDKPDPKFGPSSRLFESASEEEPCLEVTPSNQSRSTLQKGLEMPIRDTNDRRDPKVRKSSLSRKDGQSVPKFGPSSRLFESASEEEPCLEVTPSNQSRSTLQKGLEMPISGTNDRRDPKVRKSSLPRKEGQSVLKFGPSSRLFGTANEEELDPEVTPSNQIRSILQKGLGMPMSSTNDQPGAKARKNNLQRKLSSSTPPPPPPPTARADLDPSTTTVGREIIVNTISEDEEY